MPRIEGMETPDLVAAAQAVLEDAKHQRPDLTYVPVPIFEKEFHGTMCWFRGLITANQVGKSTAVGMELHRHCMGENPTGYDWPLRFPPPIRCWWTTPTFAQLEQGPYKVLHEILPKDPRLAVLQEASHRLIYPESGSAVLFKTCEQDLLTWESDTIHVWAADEEHPEAYFDAALVRLARHKGIILLSATLIETARAGGTSWLTRRFLEPWLRGRWEKSHPKNKVHFIRAGMKDCPWYTHDDIEHMRANMDPMTARVKLDGEIVSLAGSGVFPLRRLDLLKQDPWPEPVWRGDVEPQESPDTGPCMEGRGDSRWLENGAGGLRVWAWPAECHPYVIGGDFAEGIDGGDFTALTVLDRLTGEVVAAWHGHCPPFEAAHRMAVLGYLYNEAWLIPEVNAKEGGSVVTEIVRLAYPKLYHRHDESTPGRSDRKPGWLTTSGTRPMMIDAVMRMLPTVGEVGAAKVEPWLKMNWQVMWEEARAFAIINGRPDHPEGGHDDLLFSLALALRLHMDERYAFEAVSSEWSAVRACKDPVSAFWVEAQLEEKKREEAKAAQLERFALYPRRKSRGRVTLS